MFEAYQTRLIPSTHVSVLGLSIVEVEGRFEVTDNSTFTLSFASPLEALALIWEVQTAHVVSEVPR